MNRQVRLKEGALVKTGDVLEKPVTGERAVIRIGTEQTNGELLVSDMYIRPGGAVMGEHLHPALEERFTVLRLGSGSGCRGGRALRSRG